jgi:hypothetical protein
VPERRDSRTRIATLRPRIEAEAARDPAPFETRSYETAQTRLAHWPPPFRSNHAKPVIKKAPRGEEPKRAKPRGWRITRAMFSEFEEE